MLILKQKGENNHANTYWRCNRLLFVGVWAGIDIHRTALRMLKKTNKGTSSRGRATQPKIQYPEPEPILITDGLRKSRSWQDL
jgi:hypothetical protein